jgi:GrpB-like predicted nucleotidyltransferase (UPF0157 family)
MESQRTRIVVVEYDPAWPSIFEELRIPVKGALGELAVAIEHVGSTAVPGLAAKPVIDMDVVIPSPADLAIVVERLATLGYAHQGDLGIRGREAFLAPASKPAHHLYVCPVDGDELRRHRLFRDYLRAHPEAARRYAALKKDAARRFPDDRVAYTEAKSHFIEEVLQMAETGGLSND